MDNRISPFAFLFSVIIALGVLLGATVTVPHDRYHRFQSIDFVTTRKADWIYERLNFDPTPVDVALIGTSRMGAGLSSPKIEQLYCEATGRRIHVANISMPATGRNMHYVIAKELLRTKKPALTIIELNEVEARKPHKAFVFLAESTDIFTAPILINMQYFSDILRLPGRQIELFFKGILGRHDVRKTFNRADYQGKHLDRTKSITTINGDVISRDIFLNTNELETLTKTRLENQAPLYALPKSLRGLEYRFPRVYLNKIRRLATQKGSDIGFVYLPAYRAPGSLPTGLMHELQINEPILTAGTDLPEQPFMWLDATHVNALGANHQTAAFTERLISTYPTLGVERPCR